MTTTTKVLSTAGVTCLWAFATPLYLQLANNVLWRLSYVMPGALVSALSIPAVLGLSAVAVAEIVVIWRRPRHGQT